MSRRGYEQPGHEKQTTWTNRRRRKRTTEVAVEFEPHDNARVNWGGGCSAGLMENARGSGGQDERGGGVFRGNSYHSC